MESFFTYVFTQAGTVLFDAPRLQSCHRAAQALRYHAFLAMPVQLDDLQSEDFLVKAIHANKFHK